MSIRVLAATACLASLPSAVLAGAPPVIHAEEPGLWEAEGRTLEYKEHLVIGVEDGDEDYVFGQIGGMTVDADGNLYVIDRGFYCVKKFTGDGEYLLQFGRQGEGPGEFNRPGAIATDNAGRVYVAGMGARINVFEPDGTPIEDFRTHIPTGINLSMDIADDGTLYLVKFDAPSERMIHVYGTDRAHVRSFCDSYAVGRDVPLEEQHMSATGSLTLAPDGTVYYTQGYPYEIRRFTAGGKLLRRIVRENDFMVPVKVTRSGDRVGFRMGSAGYRIIPFADGTFLNAVRIPTFRDNDVDWTTVLDLFDAEGRLLATTDVEGNLFLGCADNEGRLWWSDLRTFPRVVRWEMARP